MREVGDLVGHERAARAALFPSRAEHEVLHQQLAPAFEQVGERAGAVGERVMTVRQDARLADGRTLVYGNMGGDGQPQSQSAVFNRIAFFGMNPQEALDAPRTTVPGSRLVLPTKLEMNSLFGCS